MLYILALAFTTIFISFPIRFWLSVHRLGRLDAAIRTDAHMLALDVVTVALYAFAIYWPIHDYFGLTIPGFDSPFPGLMAVICAGGCLLVGYFNGRQRWDDATQCRAGMAEAALRWLATREIITAAEVAHCLNHNRRVQP